ncbi:MAG: ABC transporter permease subunit [Yoonia sp.]|nr:ABC transporter permease subunit [Yoonia sp.]MDG1861750.1 ABC transporter permease subunit [Yoonia sp.]
MSVSEAPKPAFRLSQLIYDSRYRSLTIQVVTLALFCLGLWWLGNNAYANLDKLGLTPDFGFLQTRAGYDIGETLIPYDSSSTHGRAALVGIFNTLLLAAMGCSTALVIGVLAGVLRLSKNWVVSKLMSFYVEGFRNVPLLLWIFLIFAIFTESRPPPNTFKPNADGIAENEMWLGAIASTNQGTFIPSLSFSTLGWVIWLTLALALVAVYFLAKYAKKIQSETGRIVPVLLPAIGIIVVPLVVAYFALSAISSKTEYTFVAVGAEQSMDLATYSEAIGRPDYCAIGSETGAVNGRRYIEEAEVNFRRRDFFGQSDAQSAFEQGTCNLIAVPVATAEAIAADLTEGLRNKAVAGVLTDRYMEGQAIEVSYPVMSPKGIPRFEGGGKISNPLIALWIALSLYTGAFIAETVRAGILSVSKGQTEAAAALGIRPNRLMQLVVLPQALRVIIPPLISQFLNLTKNSSLAIAVSYPDIRGTLGGITLNQTGRALECMLLLGIFYLALSLAISFVMNIYNNRMKLKER